MARTRSTTPPPGAPRRGSHTPLMGHAVLPRPARGRPNVWIRRGLVFLTCVLLLDALYGDRGLAETTRARQDYDAAAAGLEGLRQENAGLREQIRRLESDPAAIEAVAREQLGLIRPGEILIVVRDAN